MHLAEAELSIVGVQNAIASDTVFQRKRFGLELNAILAGYVRSYVELRCLLLVGMAIFEDNFGIANGKAVDIGDTPAKDERIVIKTEIGGIAKGDFTNFRPALRIGIGDETNTGFLCYLLHSFAEVAESLDRSKVLGLQDELSFEISNVVEGSAVRVGGITS